jgi:glycine cleavage system transcriptional repressor
LLETISLDSPGIVQAVTGILNKHGINIEELETETEPAPWSGTPTFHMRAKVILRNEATVFLLKDDLNRLEAEKDLEISLNSLDLVVPA